MKIIPSWNDEAAPVFRIWSNIAIALLVLVIVLKIFGIIGWILTIVSTVILIPVILVLKLMEGISSAG